MSTEYRTGNFATSRQGAFINHNSSVGTSATNINWLNEQFELQLQKYEEMFLYLLTHSYFEDGYSNQAIDFLEFFYKQNNYVTIAWIQSLYAGNLKDCDIISGLLQCLAYLEIKPRYFISILKASISDNSPLVVDAAIKLAEVWRTKETLDVLDSVTLKWDSLEHYRSIVADELKSELEDVD